MMILKNWREGHHEARIYAHTHSSLNKKVHHQSGRPSIQQGTE
jgi:hypothetical protein